MSGENKETMQMQHQITEKKPLLDEQGRLTEAGYATSMILDYDRSAIKAGSTRIKEWDYYFIGNGKIGVALTIADNSYMGLDSISFLDFEKGWEKTKSPMRIFPMGKTGFPSSSESGDVEIFGKKYFLSFKNDGTRRMLSFRMDDFHNGGPIRGEIFLENPQRQDLEPGAGREAVTPAETKGASVAKGSGGASVGGPADSMVIATPFPEKDTAFYYNQKINCMPASGFVEMQGRRYEFDPSESFGLLDWGRGVWTYKNTWYWGSASGLYKGKPFGFNIGYGFGDTSAATENMLFYMGKAHKLSRVTFNIPTGEDGKEDYMKPWTFTSDDGRFEMDFLPVLDRASKTSVGVICSDQHQTFGKFTGKAVLDDGTVIEL
ncbi:MAG: DUF2804 domain-containing protein, partial [Bacillota bacterium]|nr:DUF2804 domain-containing protein [Bacillota bacterium]